MIRLHKILRSDDDRHFHDHPFDFVSFILHGHYVEVTPDGKRSFFDFDINRKRAEELHRLVLPEGGPVWTLVFTGPKRRSWGFQTEAGWVHWREYVADRDYSRHGERSAP